MRHLGRWWVVIVALATAVVTEWLHRPSWLWVGLYWAVAAGVVAALWPLVNGRRKALAATVAVLALSLALAQRRLWIIDTQWAVEREARVEAAGRMLDGELRAAFQQVIETAAGAARVGDRASRRGAFDALDALLPSDGREAAVVILGPNGLPWAWAGRHRLPPRLQDDSIAVQSNGYYLVLETRRHSADGRVAIASVLVWAHPAVPDGERSLAARFRARTETTLRVYPAGTAPDSPDVFDYEYDEPITGESRLLFSVQPIPPEQGEAKEYALARGRQAVTWLVLIVLGLGFALTARPGERFLLFPLVLWLALRTPFGRSLGLEPLFSPATFFRPFLGPFSASAGVLALTGLLLLTAGVWLWRRRLPRRPIGMAIGALLLLAAPYLISALGRGITPPVGGAPIGLWLTWQITLVLNATALIVLAAALFRGEQLERRRSHIFAGIAIALVASVVGIFVWSPQGGWPEWYVFLWTPALVLVALPAPRWVTIVGVAAVAGSLAALATWDAELRGRLQAAQRDVARLGEEPDPLAMLQLERLGQQLDQVPPPKTVSDLYALWRSSGIATHDYPAYLALWSTAGERLTELPLDSLDLPAPLLAAMVRNLGDAAEPQVAEVLRVPGVHYVLVARVDSATVLTAAAGPRSALITRGRLGRLLAPEPRGLPAYRLSISPPLPDRPPGVRRLEWTRGGWVLHADQTLTLTDSVREIHADIDLRGPVPLLVRGVLVVFFDTVVLALVWLLAEAATGAPIRLPRRPGLARSFRFRLAVTLAVFFVLPAVGFAVWGFTRLADEAERGRDLLIAQNLRDAAPAAAEVLPQPPGEREADLRQLSERVDADLALYRGGLLVAASDSLLQYLGIISPLMDRRAFRSVALEGELQVTHEGPSRSLADRIGYRIVEPGPPTELGVLATPQLADESGLAVRQLDLGLVLLLVTLLGVAAALIGAQAAARTLSRPVAELRRSALAIGQGRPMPPPAHDPPLEFEPVFGAFERMAADIRATQHALEEARRRTATVLATVATGVVGLDPEGRVLIANRQAIDLLGVPLPEGAPFVPALSRHWAALKAAVQGFLAEPQTAQAATELSVNGRRLTLQLASLGPDLRGVVLALNDVTELSQAERVLAWGDMARQVAHEIKNPLTPMRLGIQHLRRVYRERPSTFDRALGETSERILNEIDRLDTIARAFSRFAAPVEAPHALEQVELGTAAGEVVQLYRLAGEGADVRLVAREPSWVAARRDEVKEVLVNLLENARNAGAQHITVTVSAGEMTVADDGSGIPSDLLPHIFEPRFSTTTSGSGLGLAIVRRVVESWGGSVSVQSAPGEETVATVRFAPR